MPPIPARPVRRQNRDEDTDRMKAMIVAFVVCGVIAAAAPTVLYELGYTTEAKHAGDAVRLGDVDR